MAKKTRFVVFLSIVLDLVLRMEVERFVGECDRDATGHLFVRGADKGGILGIPWDADNRLWSRDKEAWAKLGVSQILYSGGVSSFALLILSNSFFLNW